MTRAELDSRLTLPHVAAWAALQFGAADALIDAGQHWSFAELWQEARRVAAAFLALGIGPGDVVGIWAPNSAQWIFGTLGAQICGAAIVPLNTRFRGQEAGDLLRRTRARALVVKPRFLDTDYLALLADEDLPDLRQVISVGAAEGIALGWQDFCALGAAIDDTAVDAALARLTDTDISDIMFTSGTTGRPKGVMSAHGQNVRAFLAWSDAAGLRAGDRYLIVNPFFHVFGFKAGWLSCLLRGAAIMPMAVFDVAETARRIEAEKITFFPGPPTIFQTLLSGDWHKKHDFSSLRVGVTGAAVIPPSLIERMGRDLGFETVLSGYGLTESTGVVSMCAKGDSAERVASTCGRAIPGIELAIIDDSGAQLPAGEAGEIVVRGFNVMRGYLDDPVATAEAIDAEGWLHTGDVGVCDAEGYLRITDRKKEMFICGGFNCYPAEIERMLSAHENIAMVAVIGVPDERMGEVGRAFVVLRPGAVMTDADIITWARDIMANYKAPRQVRIVPSLPINASGKVVRADLRKLGV